VRAAFVFPAVGDPGYDACATQHESRRYKPHARLAIDKRKRIAMKVSASIALAATAAAVLAAATLLPRAHAESQIDRGKYLVTLAGCNDCHAPGVTFSANRTWRAISADRRWRSKFPVSARFPGETSRRTRRPG
jgi:uncharacterized membrane protein